MLGCEIDRPLPSSLLPSTPRVNSSMLIGFIPTLASPIRPGTALNGGTTSTTPPPGCLWMDRTSIIGDCERISITISACAQCPLLPGCDYTQQLAASRAGQVCQWSASGLPFILVRQFPASDSATSVTVFPQQNFTVLAIPAPSWDGTNWWWSVDFTSGYQTYRGWVEQSSIAPY